MIFKQVFSNKLFGLITCRGKRVVAACRNGCVIWASGVGAVLLWSAESAYPSGAGGQALEKHHLFPEPTLIRAVTSQ